MRSLSLICALTCLFGACASEDFGVDDNPDLADETNPEYYQLALGEKISGLSIVATSTGVPPEPSAELEAVIKAEIKAAQVVLVLELEEGEAAVVIMDGKSDSFDSLLKVRAGTYPNLETVAGSDNSAILGSLSEKDSVVSLRQAGTYYIVASSPGLASTGQFSVQAIAVSPDLPDLSAEYREVTIDRKRALSELRGDWARLQEFTNSEFVQETASGLIAGSSVPLKNRNSVNVLVKSVNEERAKIHAELGGGSNIIGLMQPVYQAMYIAVSE